MKPLLLRIQLCFIVFCSMLFANLYNDNLLNKEKRFPFKQLGYELECGTIVVSKEVDLEGKTCFIPDNYSLVFKGGLIKNGELNGKMTKIVSSGVIFDNVKISGTWELPIIKTSMFADLNYENSLKDVLALSNPNVNNIIEISASDYQVKAQKNRDVCLMVVSNTTVILDGNINLSPNMFERYDIIRATGENIVIQGCGSINGDKYSHLGKTGEWGMGVRFHDAINSSVSGITIRDCWGDCIYVGGNSKKVNILNCNLENGRRQGISVTKADNVVIKDCLIRNVGGTNPEYAIDIEPNRNDTIDHIWIESLNVINCKGGILVTKPKKKEKLYGSVIKSIMIRDCNISVDEKYPICVNKCLQVVIEKCRIDAKSNFSSIYVNDVDSATIRNNFIFLRASNSKKDNLIHPIDISQVAKQTLINNSIIEK